MHVYVLAIRKPAKYNKTTENNSKTFFRCHDCNLMMCKISNAALSELMELMGSGITTVYEPSSKKKKKNDAILHLRGEKRGWSQLYVGRPDNKKCIGLPADIKQPGCTNRPWY